jgi:hypothetical protein
MRRLTDACRRTSHACLFSRRQMRRLRIAWGLPARFADAEGGTVGKSTFGKSNEAIHAEGTHVFHRIAATCFVSDRRLLPMQPSWNGLRRQPKPSAPTSHPRLRNPHGTTEYRPTEPRFFIFWPGLLCGSPDGPVVEERSVLGGPWPLCKPFVNRRAWTHEQPPIPEPGQSARLPQGGVSVCGRGAGRPAFFLAAAACERDRVRGFRESRICPGAYRLACPSDARDGRAVSGRSCLS